MGGIAFRAPVLASLFLIVSLATLAMPGSSNFVGEFMILLGLFKAKLAIAMIASLGVVGAAVYALRLYIRVDAQPRRRRRALARDRAAARRWRSCRSSLVILVLAFYPQFGLRRSEPSVKASIAAARAAQHAALSRRRLPPAGPPTHP